MKRSTLLSAIMVAIFILFISVPAFAFGDTDIDIDTHISGVHDSIIAGGDVTSTVDNSVDKSKDITKNSYNTDSHDKTLIVKDNLTGIQKGKNNTAINGDGNTIDNSVDKSKDQNGLVNQKGDDNMMGLVNVKGDDHQVGLINAKGGSVVGGVNTGFINTGKMVNKTHSGNSHNDGIIEQSTNNSGIIINQQQKGKDKGGYGDDGQGGSSGGDNIVTASIDNSTCIVEDKREHHTGTPVTFASLGSYTEGRFAGAAFQTAKMLTMFKDTFSYEGASEVYGKAFGKGLCITTGKSFNGRHEDDPSKSIKVYTLDDKIVPESIKAIGFLTIKGTPGEDATSFIVMQKAILSACIMQGDAIVVTKEGAETITKSSGWGIGFNTSGSVINDMDNRGRSAAASGGTGYSSGKGSLEVIPWMTVQVLKFK